jgi:hypothetical protein
MNASDVEVGDIVMVYGIKTGKVVHKFLSETGEEVSTSSWRMDHFG